MTAPLMVRFLVELTVRTGPKLTDSILMQPGQVVELTDALKSYNRSAGVSLFDHDPSTHVREFGRRLFEIGCFPEVPDDPNAGRWYAPLDEPRFADIDTTVPRTSHTTTYYAPFRVESHPADRTDRYEP